MFNGLGMNLGNLSRLSNAKTISLSAENIKGEKGRGGMSTDGAAQYAARDLGQGWKVSPYIVLEPGEVATLADIDGSGAIEHIWFADTAGRDFILRFYWDNQENPSVLVPLCDFFGGGWHTNIGGADNRYPTLQSLPVTSVPNRGYSCYWEMPFRKHCRITLENVGEKRNVCYYQITYTQTEVPEDAAYFCAQFRRQAPVEAGKDYVIADGIKGKGHYVGTLLYVGLNGEGGWWGEGEVKMFLDGDTDFPSYCGTGTEDYFCGAYDWDVNGQYQVYSTPFSGMYQVQQSNGLYQSQQRFAMYRWHVMDPIRFEHDFKITIQDLGWREGGRYLQRRDDMCSVAFWYQTLPTQELTIPDRKGLEII